MIEIITRRVGQYCNIEIQIDSFKKDMGLYSDKQLKEIIYELKEAVEDLEGYI